jgi:hypothetical protein
MLIMSAGQDLYARADGNVQSREKPKWLKMRIEQPFLALEIESDDQKSSSGPMGTTVTDETLNFTPSFGFNMAGSIFHPYFLEYDFLMEQGFTQGDREPVSLRSRS